MSHNTDVVKFVPPCRSADAQMNMRSLLQFLVFCSVICLCACYDDSDESKESAEDVFLPSSQANIFVVPRSRSIYSPNSQNGFRQYNFMRRLKSPLELRAETCEDYFPCRFYAYQHGFQQAYQRYYALRLKATQKSH
ncbi:matrix Gla protein isoform X1 [Takifugu rubripes]|nr:matrix Gla protein isoform X1 [Takifugu rubripes]XP_029692848.1 matrix Gla protein isoform X1 [Takifugu rubripes]